MEHYRSTLGTAAAAVFGLVAAARVLHPGNFEESPRAARPVRAEATAASAPSAAWIDPPFALYLRPSASSSEMAVLAPRLTAPLPAGMTMMPTLPAEMATVVDQPRETGMQHRRKASRGLVSARQAIPERSRTAQASSMDARSPPAEKPDGTSHDFARDGDG